MNKLKIYTDGACQPNPGKGGWAWVEETTGAKRSGYHPHTTNNVMELTAILEAVKHFSGTHMIVYSDSQYAINSVTVWANKKRRKNKARKNKELIDSIIDLLSINSVEFVWVRGHSGNYLNDQADFLAQNEISYNS